MERPKTIPVIVLYCALIVPIYSIIGYVNSYIANLKGASKDAEYFVALATEWAEFGELGFYVNSQFYAQFTGIFYRIFGSSEFVSVQINIIALVAIGILLNKLLKMQGVPFIYRLLCVMFVGFWPTMVPRAASAMREPLLILSFLWVYFEIVKIRSCAKFSSYASLFIAAFFGFSLHKAGAILVPIYLVLGGLYWLPSRVRMSHKAAYLTIIAVAVIALLLVRGSETLSSVAGLRELNSIINLDLEQIGKIFDHKANIAERASYHVTLDLSSASSAFFSIPRVLFYYMLQPFPQNIGNAYDLVAFLEVLFRMILLIYLFAERARLSRESRLLLLFYISGCLLWSVGTTNWGTAQRHHLTTNWMLVLLFVQHRYSLNFKLEK